MLYNEVTGEIHAAVAGVLSAVTNTSVRVTAKLVIPGDIDFQTGNVESRAAVQIGGSLKPGFKVITGGDVLVGGSVESAHKAIARLMWSLAVGSWGKGHALRPKGMLMSRLSITGFIACKDRCA